MYSKMSIPKYMPHILVGGIPTRLKNMTSSVGMMTFPTEWKVIKFMFQTTNQVSIWICLKIRGLPSIIAILLEQIDDYPLVNVYMPMETIIFNGKTHYFYGHVQ